MSNDPSTEASDTLFGLINGTIGKITVFVTFITSIFTVFKLIRGDTRIAIVILFFFGSGVLWLVSLYIIVKKTKRRTTTVRGGIQVDARYAYGNSRRIAALTVIAIVSVLWVVAVVYRKHTLHGSTVNILQAITGEKVNLAGFVLTAGGEPADKALVTVFVNDKASATQEAPAGKFSFGDINITELGSGTLRIQAKWRTLESPITNLSVNQLDNVVLRLPAGPAPFKVDYFVLEGPAIDFLLQGRMDNRWEAKLGGQPTIVVNDVFHDLKDLLDKFSESFQFQTLEVSNSKARSRSATREIDPRLAGNRPFFLGGDRPRLLSKPLKPEEFDSLLQATEKWHLIITPVRFKPDPSDAPLSNANASSFFFWRFANSEDVKMVLQSVHEDKTASFYAYITKNYLPPQFFIFEMRPSSVRGGCQSPTGVALLTRSLRLRVAVLENTSDNNVRIGKFFTKSNPLNRLRTREEDASLLEGKPIEQKTFYPSELLKPKEKLVVPLELLLANDTINIDAQRDYIRETPAEVVSELGKVGKVSLPVGSRLNVPPIEVSTRTLMSMIDTPNEDPRLSQEYIYGASLKIETLDVDGINFPFRSLDTNVVVMNGGYRGASCPYVFTYALESNVWVNEGPILYQRDRKWKDGRDEKELMHFDGSIVLAEEEPEISFVDRIRIKALSVDGRETLLSPNDYHLFYDDGTYLVLRQGDQRRIDFSIPKGLRASKFVLIADGYYLPYPNRK